MQAPSNQHFRQARLSHISRLGDLDEGFRAVHGGLERDRNGRRATQHARQRNQGLALAEISQTPVSQPDRKISVQTLLRDRAFDWVENLWQAGKEFRIFSAIDVVGGDIVREWQLPSSLCYVE